MKKHKPTRLIYNKDFYTLQAVMSSQKFARLKKEFHKELAKRGAPMPEEGFKTVKEYHEWTKIANEKLAQHYTLMQELLEQFGLVYTDEYRMGLAWNILFGHKKGPLVSTYGIGMYPTEDKKALKVNLTLYPWTREEDLIENIWDQIKPALKQLPGYKDRNRQWDTFERDFAVYELFLKVNQDIKMGKKPKGIKSNSPYLVIAEYEEFENLKRLYKAENLEDFVRSIVSRCKRTFGNTNFL